MLAAAIRYEFDIGIFAFKDEAHLMLHLSRELGQTFKTQEEVIDYVNEEGVPFDFQVLDLEPTIEIHVCPMMLEEATGDYILHDGKRQEDILFIDVEVREYLPTGEIKVLEEFEGLAPAQEPLGSIVARLEEKYDVAAEWL